jgi:hypothetical protein
MTFPIDFWTHPKVSRLSDAAFRAFVESNGQSRMRETDGVLEPDDAEFLWKPDVLEELVRSHPSRPLMFKDDDGNYVLRDYAEHQFTKDDRDKLSQKRKEAAEKRWANASAVQVQSNPKQPDARKGIGIGIGTGEEVGNEVDGYVSSAVADATDRPEITELLDLLDSEIRANGGKAPARTKRNIDATRLLLDKDGRSVDQIAKAIRWCQADEFWRANILSMSKLREKYDQLRLAATRTGAPKQSRADENAADYYRYYGGNDERAGSVPALDPGVG